MYQAPRKVTHAPEHVSPITTGPITTGRLQLAAPAVNASEQRTLRLGDGTLLSFSQSDLPASPFVSFAKDIPRLGRMWDDTLPGWDMNDCVLHVKGHPIALKYWPHIFRWRSGTKWDKLKKPWHEWQVRPSLFSHRNLQLTIEEHDLSFSLNVGIGQLQTTSGLSSLKVDSLSRIHRYLPSFVSNGRKGTRMRQLAHERKAGRHSHLSTLIGKETDSRSSLFEIVQLQENIG